MRKLLLTIFIPLMLLLFAPQTQAQEIHMNRIRANGIDFQYLEAGQPTAPLILLLHGFPDSAHTFDDLIPRLAARGYHVVAPFMRGYYPTSIPADDDYSAESLGQDVLALIKGLGQQEATVIGHDWGAMAAYVAANIDPSRIKKLITLAIPHPGAIETGPGFFYHSPQFAQLPLGATSEWMVRRNDFAYLGQIYGKWSPSWIVPPDQVSAMKVDFSRPGRLRAALGYYRSFIRDGLNPKKMNLIRGYTSVQTLCLEGDEDGATYLGWFKKSYQLFTGSYKLIFIDKAGHFLHREQPDLVARYIMDFLVE